MKRCIVVTLALILLFAFGVSAQTFGKLNIEFDESFVTLTEESISKNPEIVEWLGYTDSSMQKYFEDNDLVVFAANEDNSRQIQVKCRETEFSKQLGDLSLLDEENAENIVEKILPIGANDSYSLLWIDDMLMYELNSVSSDSGGSFCSVQYVTIRDGKLYSIGFFENGTQLSNEFKDIIDRTVSTLSISTDNKVTVSHAENLTEVIIVWVLIIVAAVGTVGLLVSIFAQLNTNRTADGKQFFIRRRKK